MSTPCARTVAARALTRSGVWLAALVGVACERDPPLAVADELLPVGAGVAAAVDAPRPVGAGSESLSLGISAEGVGALTPGVIRIDGSSTVFPIAEAIAEEFRTRNAAHITIGVSGTSGGLEKLCNAEVAISGASRPLRSAEADLCRARRVQYVELPIAYDGIALVVHPDNDWATELTAAELKALWRPEAQRQVTRWAQVRAGWPDAEIHLLGPGVDSGTYDYFTLAIVGREHASRGDYGASEDDHLIARGVSRDPLALGFFGYAYYADNRERLRLVGIDDQREENGRGAVRPSAETVRNGSYGPLSRPLFLYVSLAAAARPEVEAFVRFALERAQRLVEDVGYVALSDNAYRLARRRFDARVVGSVLGESGSRVGVSVESLLAVE